jgi:hypothetical protein
MSSKGVTGGEDFFQIEEFDFIQRLELSRRELRQGRFDVHGKTVFYSTSSLYCMTRDSAIRRGMVWLVEWK